MSAIFISYRREDAEDSARALYESLLREFGKERLFMDVEAIALGSDFREAVEGSLDNCGVFLAIIGPRWLDTQLPNDPAGRRRLDTPGDYVRQEVATALKRGSKLPVIPVLVRGATMPNSDQLPDDLKDLAYRNALTLSHLDWDGNVQKLVSAIKPRLCEEGDSRSGPGKTSSSLPGPSTARPAIVPQTSRALSSSSGGMNKALLVGVPALIIAVLVGYFALRPDKPRPTPDANVNQPTSQQVQPASGNTGTNPKPEQTSEAAATPANTATDATSSLAVTLLGNPTFAGCSGNCSLWIDGVAAGNPYTGQSMQLHLTSGQHHYRFAQSNKPLRCEGSFLVAAGQTSFVPRWRNANSPASNCEMEPDQQTTVLNSPPAPSTTAAAAPVMIALEGNPQAWQKRSLTIDGHVVSSALRSPVKLKLAPGQHRFLLTGPSHECKGAFAAAPGQIRFSLQWPAVDVCRIVPST